MRFIIILALFAALLLRLKSVEWTRRASETAPIPENPCELDASFGVGGKAVTAVSGGQDTAYAVALQADGKVLVAGRSADEQRSSFALVRYTAAGLPDVTFGSGGVVRTQLTDPRQYAPAGSVTAVGVQPGGRIVVVGTRWMGETWRLVLVGYRPDGMLDGSFGVNGGVADGGDGFSEVRSLTIQPDGKLLVLGSRVLARYLPDGGPDLEFGAEGTLADPFGRGESGGEQEVLLQPDGKILVAGGIATMSGYAFGLARFGPTGSLDPTFGDRGKVSTLGGWAYGAALQPDGRVVLAGYRQGDTALALARYNPDGSLDGRFGNGGISATPFGQRQFGQGAIARKVAVQADGTILAAGGLSGFSPSTFLLARYRPDGTLDGTFGDGGFLLTAMGPGDSVLWALAMQPDGRILAAGSTALDGRRGFAVARYQTLTLPLPLGAPVLMSPARCAEVPLSLASLTLAWDLPVAATQYELEIRPANDDGPGAHLVRNAASRLALEFPPRSYVLLPGMTYRWRLRSSDSPASASPGDPSWGPWSETRTFRTEVRSSARLQAVSPADGAAVNGSDGITLEWWPGDGHRLFYFEVQVSGDPRFDAQPKPASSFVWWNLAHAGLNDPSYSWKTPPLPSGTYYWRVRPRVQGDGVPVAWGPTWKFTVADTVPREPVAGPWIAFTARRPSEGSEIYLVHEDGSGLANLTRHPADDWNPVWSPDGRRLAFRSRRASSTGSELYVINADGTGLRRVTHNSGEEHAIAWAPDGERLAFVSEAEGDRAEVCILSIAPDTPCRGDIYTIRADGSELRRLTDRAELYRELAWSPDGTRISFHCWPGVIRPRVHNQRRRRGHLEADRRRCPGILRKLVAGRQDRLCLPERGVCRRTLHCESGRQRSPEAAPAGGPSQVPSLQLSY